MIIFNASMLNKNPTGVGVYSLKLIKIIKTHFDFKYKMLYIRDTKFLSVYRLFWNFFVLPFRAYKKDLIFSFSTHGTPFHRKQIITIHDLICLNFPEQHKFQYYYFKYLVPLVLRSCKHIVAISEFTKSEIVKFYDIDPNKISVIHNGANIINYSFSDDTEKQMYEITKGRSYFISVGAAYSHKNTEKLIEAAELVKNSDVLFLIVGKKNEYLQKIEDMVHSKKLENVKFLNYVDDNLLAGLYSKALANVYLSLYEGFGFPPLEAASVGTISVVSDIAVMREIYSDNVKYVDPVNVESIAAGLLEIYNDESYRNSLKHKLPELVQKYDWHNTARSNVDLIKRFAN